MSAPVVAIGTGTLPPGTVVLSDGSTFEPGSGGAGSPTLAFMTDDGRHYLDPLPWCQLLGSLGYPRQGFEMNVEFPSVTTKLNELPTWRLVAWYGLKAAECAMQPHVQAMAKRFPTLLLRWVAEAGNRTRDVAGERGSLVHDIAEDTNKIIHRAVDDLLQGRHPDPWFTTKANCAPYVRGLVKFFKAYPGIRPIWVEVTVFSRRYGYGGTLDLIAWVPGLGIVLIDWKTSNTMQPKMSFQMIGYEHAEYAIVDGIRVPLPKVIGNYVVHIMPGDPDVLTGYQDGAFEVVPMDRDPGQLEIFPAMTTVKKWNTYARIGKPLPDPSMMGLSQDVYGQAEPDLAIVSPVEAAAMAVLGEERTNAELFASALGPPVPGPLVDVLDTTRLMTEDDLPEPDRSLAKSEPASLPEMLFDPAEALAESMATHLKDEREWFRGRLEYMIERAEAGDGEAATYLGELSGYWSSSGLPKANDPAFGVDEALQWRYAELLDRAQQSCDLLEAPFVERPVAPDWDDLLVTLTNEATYYPPAPAPTMDDLGRVLEAARAGVLDSGPRQVVTLAHRGHSIAPGEWGTPANPSLVEECKALADRASKLPADMRAELDRWKLSLGLPNLRTISVTPEHLKTITAKVEEMWDEWSQRTRDVLAIITATVDPDGLYEFTELLLTETGDVDTIEQASAIQIAGIELLCRAMVRGDVGLREVDGELKFASMVTELDLVTKYATKSGVREAARPIADRLGVPLPRSAALIADDIVLVAALGEPDVTVPVLDTLDASAPHVYSEVPGDPGTCRCGEYLGNMVHQVADPDEVDADQAAAGFTYEIGEGLDVEP